MRRDMTRSNFTTSESGNRLAITAHVSNLGRRITSGSGSDDTRSSAEKRLPAECGVRSARTRESPG